MKQFKVLQSSGTQQQHIRLQDARTKEQGKRLYDHLVRDSSLEYGPHISPKIA